MQAAVLLRRIIAEMLCNRKSRYTKQAPERSGEAYASQSTRIFPSRRHGRVLSPHYGMFERSLVFLQPGEAFASEFRYSGSGGTRHFNSKSTTR